MLSASDFLSATDCRSISLVLAVHHGFFLNMQLTMDPPLKTMSDWSSRITTLRQHGRHHKTYAKSTQENVDIVKGKLAE